jgi:hypothetical protein
MARWRRNQKSQKKSEITSIANINFIFCCTTHKKIGSLLRGVWEEEEEQEQGAGMAKRKAQVLAMSPTAAAAANQMEVRVVAVLPNFEEKIRVA